MRQIRDLSAAGVCLHAQAVIVSHHAFDQGNIAVLRPPAQILPKLTFTAKEAVQIPAAYPKHFTVIERIDIVRAAFERRRAHAPP